VNVWVHSLTFSYTPKSIKCDSQTSFSARTFANPCLGHKPKAKVAINDVFWLNYTKVRRFNTLSKAMKKLMIDCWVQETSISPNQKDVVQRRVSVKNFEIHPKHYLQTSQVKTYNFEYNFVQLFYSYEHLFHMYAPFLVCTFC
jgi:hypothetical protein